MWTFSVMLSAALAALAWRVGRDRPAHRVIAAFVTVNAIADVLRRAFAVLVFAPARAALAGRPFVGWTRAVFHIDELLFLAWPFGLAAVACIAFFERPRRAVAALFTAYALACAVLAAGYPTIRGGRLAGVYAAVQLAALVVVLVAGAGAWARRAHPELTMGSVMILGGVEAGAVLAWGHAPMPFGWDFAATVYLVGYGALFLVHLGVVLWPPRSLA